MAGKEKEKKLEECYVSKEMLHNLKIFVLPACKIGLEDPDDDVRAVAAEDLIPTSAAIVSLKGSMLYLIIMLLWDIFIDLDDLSPSTSSVMNLLAEIYSQEQMVPNTFGTLYSKEKVDYLDRKYEEVMESLRCALKSYIDSHHINTQSDF